MQIPEQLSQAVDGAVSRSLRSELDARNLLLTRGAAAAASADLARRGAALLRRTIVHCYPGSRFPQHGEPDRPGAEIAFDDDHTAARIASALAFGATTARLLARPPRATRPAATAEPVELLCAVFNLGIGLVDGLCDGQPRIGSGFLRVLESLDLSGAAHSRQPSGWLQSAMPAMLAEDPSATFTARVIEVFFELLHSGHPNEDGAPLRDHIATLLQSALRAEHRSVDRSTGGTLVARDDLFDCSRQTSVMPFQIIEQLATGGAALPAPTPGTLLGEAMWRIDDLVDLVQDATLGSLNAVLLAATDEVPDAFDTSAATDPIGAVERVLTSGAIARVAAEAASCLDEGLAAEGHSVDEERRWFLFFVQRYAGTGPG